MKLIFLFPKVTETQLFSRLAGDSSEYNGHENERSNANQATGNRRLN